MELSVAGDRMLFPDWWSAAKNWTELRDTALARPISRREHGSDDAAVAFRVRFVSELDVL